MSVIYNTCELFPWIVVTPVGHEADWVQLLEQALPNLDIVVYQGSPEARQIITDHVLFPDKKRDLHCHVLVINSTFFMDDAALFRQVSWEGVVIDEGDTVKYQTDTRLYQEIANMQAASRIIMTSISFSSPLQHFFMEEHY